MDTKQSQFNYYFEDDRHVSIRVEKENYTDIINAYVFPDSFVRDMNQDPDEDVNSFFKNRIG